ncbi:hypothetical protein TWF694_009166 [Orbilia ellipsospora]|uniref:Protein kinase domain-containing protein n=1 Tax=Orbilia ellipsospora TaxID=2528407 RepID=A0AAV9XE30_9PEZI
MKLLDFIRKNKLPKHLSRFIRTPSKVDSITRLPFLIQASLPHRVWVPMHRSRLAGLVRGWTRERIGASNVRVITWARFSEELAEGLAPYLTQDFPTLTNHENKTLNALESYGEGHRGHPSPLELAELALESPCGKVISLICRIGEPEITWQNRCKILGFPSRSIDLDNGLLLMYHRNFPPPKPPSNINASETGSRRFMRGVSSEEWERDRDLRLICQHMKDRSKEFQYSIVSDIESTHVIKFGYDQKYGENISVSPEIKWDGEGLESPLAAYIYATSQAYMQPKCYNVLARSSPPRGPINRWRFDEAEKLISPLPGLNWNSIVIPDTENLVFLPGRDFIVKEGKSVLEGEVVHKKKNIAVRVILKLFNCVNYERHSLAYANELAIYERLAALQGKYIPRLYASGTIDHHWGVLVLEHCGKSFQESSRSINDSLVPKIKEGVKEALEAIHKCNVLYKGIQLGNILIEKNKFGVVIKLVDFEQSVFREDIRTDEIEVETDQLKKLRLPTLPSARSRGYK